MGESGPTQQVLELRAELHKRWLEKKAHSASSGPPSDSRTGIIPGKEIMPDVRTSIQPEKMVVHTETMPAGSNRGAKRVREEEPAPAGSVKRLRKSLSNETAGSLEDTDTLPTTFSVLSWNVDGLTEQSAFTRTLAVIDTIRNEKPACILLQEITPLVESLFRRYLNAPYHILPQAESSNWVPVKSAPKSSVTRMPYYCMILLSKFHFEAPKKPVPDTYYYRGTKMARALVSVETILRDGEVPVRLATTHLESTADAECTQERKSQIEFLFEWMQDEALRQGDTGVVLLAGDLNLRDTEVKPHAALLESSGIRDVWEQVGSPESSKYTWNRRINNNLGPCSARGARLRFDRMYWWKGARCPSEFSLASFRLVGLTKVEGMYPSDHFGILGTFGGTL